ncbi:MAG: site-specific integrase [Nitrosotalea sp.]
MTSESIGVDSDLQEPPGNVERVNTAMSFAIPDEDRHKRSDVGNKMIHSTELQRTTAKNKKTELLKDTDLKRWYDNLARGSKITADVRLRRIANFCKIHNMTAKELARLAGVDLRAVTDLIEDHITWMEEKNYSPGYIENTIKSVKSWLAHFEIEIKRKLKIANADSTPTLENERVPNAEEITEIFNRTSLREAVAISLISKAGLRPQVLGNHDGTDGLTVGDMPDIIIEGGVAKCLQEPPKIIVRRTLSKARHQYFTFLSSAGTRKLLAYLNDRLAQGEKITADSPLISPNMTHRYGRGNNTNKKFLPTLRISKLIRDVFRPRFPWRPYVLRAYFDTQLLMAESRGKIAHDFRVFFMGHKGSMEAKYTTNKGLLPDTLIQEMRDAFARSEEFLDLDRVVMTENIPEDAKSDNVINDVMKIATSEDLGNMQKFLQSWAQDIIQRQNPLQKK